MKTAWLLVGLLATFGCGSDDDSGGGGAGASSGGASSGGASSGGASSGGSSGGPSGGASGASTGGVSGAASGGSSGAASGGTSGASTGGSSGASSGGASSGGTSSGGASSGGSSSGGTSSGGASSGGSSSGGTSSGGTGGSGTGGSGGQLLFFDNFNYTMNRLDSGAVKQAAATAAGYSGLKDEQTKPGGALGYLYTVNSVEGDASGIPGGGRALCLESLGNTLQGQTDYYVQLGSGSPGAFPADLWIQAWMYVQADAASGKSSVIAGRNKLIYPLLGSNAGYPSATQDTAWLLSIRPDAHDIATGNLISQPHPAAFAFESRGLYSGATGTRAYHPHLAGTGLEDYMYPNVNVGGANARFIMPNQWYLVRFHFDTSGATNSNTSVFEVWWRSKGAQAGGLIKKIEFIGGQAAPGSPNFSFHNRLLDNVGAKMLRIPTTVGSQNAPWGDSWIYLKDLAVAANASSLPVYASY